MLNQSSGHVIVEVPILSGYNLDLERSKEMLMMAPVKHVYLQEGVVYLALDEVFPSVAYSLFLILFLFLFIK